MPTGYTSDIAKGITFQKFVLQCARAFGALIEMRDDPLDAPIPEEFKPSDYYDKQIKESTRELARLRKMSDRACERKAAEHCRLQREYHERAIVENRRLAEKYEAMLEQVKAWEPPTADHRELKEFMVQQITESLTFDCSGDYHQKALRELEGMAWRVWKANQIAERTRSLEYAMKERKAEHERVTSRNKWIQQLRASLRNAPK